MKTAKKNIPSWVDAQFERQVTAAEAQKGHITITADSIPLFVGAFGRINRESDSKRDPRKGLHRFHRANDGAPVLLKLVFRNAPRNELRLYFNAGEGVKATVGQVFYARFEGRKVWVGMRPTRLRNAGGLVAAGSRKQGAKDEDDLVNQLVYTEPRYRKLAGRTVSARQIKLVEISLRRARYRCEAGFNAPHFISKSTGRRYLEGHHLIPLGLQKQFRCNLDVLDNIFALSPHAHRAVHYGKREVVRTVLDKLVDNRPLILKTAGLSRQALYEIYSCN